MKTIHKDNQDFVFALDITTFHDKHNRVKDFNNISIKIYTNDVDEYIEATYTAIGGIYDNIIPQDDYDFIIINAADLKTLEDGIMKLHIEYQLKSNYHDDGKFNDCFDVETEFYLKEKRYTGNLKNCLIDD